MLAQGDQAELRVIKMNSEVAVHMHVSTALTNVFHCGISRYVSILQWSPRLVKRTVLQLVVCSTASGVLTAASRVLAAASGLFYS